MRDVFSPNINLEGSSTTRVRPATRRIISEPCTVVIIRGGEKHPCGLASHYVVGSNKFCLEHREVAFAAAKRSTRNRGELSERELALMAICK
jgi:hypothetical protein